MVHEKAVETIFFLKKINFTSYNLATHTSRLKTSHCNIMTQILLTLKPCRNRRANLVYKISVKPILTRLQDRGCPELM